MKPTRILDLCANVLLAAIVAWVATNMAYSSFPPISVFSGASLLPVALLEAVLAFVIRQRKENHGIGPGGSGQLHPITAARAVALAKASAQVGSLVGGIWLGFLVWLLTHSDLRAASSDTPGAVVGLIGGAALVAAALWLEYCCRAPIDPPDEAATS
ncbi:DUF3180 domain-containing protein [Nocardia sp. JMUB6875]|uniref:DUF3180 domain-containing protein n=1 Tax=Nocardia sp. JMUB6875 TaxID=3158170 RepID=UPI0032E5B407